MIWLVNFQENKNIKNTETFYLSILTSHKWFDHLNFDMFSAVIFFSARILNMCTPRTAFYLVQEAGFPGLRLYARGPAHLLDWPRMVKAGWLGSLWSEIFLQMTFILFPPCITKRAGYFPGQSVPYNDLLNQPHLIFHECYFT